MTDSPEIRQSEALKTIVQALLPACVAFIEFVKEQNAKGRLDAIADRVSQVQGKMDEAGKVVDLFGKENRQFSRDILNPASPLRRFLAHLSHEERFSVRFLLSDEGTSALKSAFESALQEMVDLVPPTSPQRTVIERSLAEVVAIPPRHDVAGKLSLAAKTCD